MIYIGLSKFYPRKLNPPQSETPAASKRVWHNLVNPSVEMFALTRENRDALFNTFIAHLVDLAAGE